MLVNVHLYLIGREAPSRFFILYLLHLHLTGKVNCYSEQNKRYKTSLDLQGEKGSLLTVSDQFSLLVSI